MASKRNVVNNFVNSVPDTPEVAFTAPTGGSGTEIIAFTARNLSTANRSYKAYIVPQGGSPINPIIPYTIIIWGDQDLGTGIEGQVVPPGGTLQIEASLNGSVFVTVSGKDI